MGARHCIGTKNRLCRGLIYAWLNKWQRRIKDKVSFYRQDWEIIKTAITLNRKHTLANV